MRSVRRAILQRRHVPFESDSRSRTCGVLRFQWVLCVLLAAGPAGAQVHPDPPSGVRLGPVFVTPVLEATNMGIDTNILREADEPKRDSVGTLTSNVRASMRIRPFRLSATSAVGFDYFRRYIAQRSVNRNQELRVDVPFNRVGFYASGALVNARERLNYEIEQRVRRMARGVAAGGEVRLTSKTTLAIEAGRSDTDFAEDALLGDVSLHQVLRHRVERASISVRVAATPLTTVILRGDTERTRFESSSVRNSNGFRVMPGFEFKTGALLTGHVFVGYRRFDPLTSRFPAFTGLVGTLDASWAAGATTRLSVAADRDLEYSYQVTDPVYVLTAVRGSLVQRLGDRWQLDGRIGRQRLVYRAMGPDEGPAPAYSVSRVDRGWRYGGGVGYQLTRQLRVAAGADYVVRQSDIRNGQFDGMRATGSIRYEFVR